MQSLTLKRSRLLLAALFGIALMLLLWLGSPGLSAAEQSRLAVFDQVWKTINDNFFDPKFNGVDWKALQQQYRSRLRQLPEQESIVPLVNQMLGELKTSHTRYYTNDDPAYYQLLGIFQPNSTELQKQIRKFFPTGKIEYTGIGLFTQELDGKLFVRAVLNDSPAAKAGFLVGDQILSADNRPFQPIAAFAGKAGKPVTVQIQRSADPGSKRELTVTPKQLGATQMFLDAQRASVQVIERQGRKIGYIHVWSYAGDQYQQLLEDELIYGRLREADGLVLDLREGWGGAPLTALNIFTGRGPSLTTQSRNREPQVLRSQWNKPVVMLVNEASRSAKEILAYGFQQYKIGTVVGAKTPGAVVAGRAFLMQDGSLLYVAVADVLVDGTTRLEGKGVVPDIGVPFNLPYAQGADPQKERAIAELLR